MTVAPGQNPQRPRAVSLWLACIFLLILGMVAVGGITRLTGSGLSIVEWRPVSGVLPPLTDAEWGAEFARYRDSPQFRRVNHWMELADFQRIFFWEYLHRLLGRVLGLTALIPWLVLVRRGVLRGPWIARTAIVFLLLAAQGALGWFMVRSGLVDIPAVSHFRLAAHLLLAFGTAQWVLWQLMSWESQRNRPNRSSPRPLPRHWWSLFSATSALVLVQIAYGAFVAGTRAGLLFPTFPAMAGTLLPGEFFPTWRDAFFNPAAIHYLHRALALALVFPLAGLLLQSRHAPAPVLRAAGRAGALVALQVALGALTVVWQIPVTLAVLHQCTGLLVLSALLVTGFHARTTRFNA